MSDYPLIADHGLIGDLQTAALVATDGSIDWFCAPRFDSPSIFGALLDHGRGGHFRVRPTVDVFTGKQLYFPDTAVLITRFMTEAGVGEVVDFMPVTGTVASDRHRLVRMVRCVRGQMTFAVDIARSLPPRCCAHEAAGRVSRDRRAGACRGRAGPAPGRAGARLTNPSGTRPGASHG
jgi:GH15 family glucan-1,4-alpha-glucosidase